MPEPAMLDYFYGDEAEQYTFYRIPKVLFTDPAYRRISSDAKILYAAGPESRASALWSDRSLSGTGKRLCKA